MDMRQVVGRNFARLRKARGLTQEEVEARSGVSQQLSLIHISEPTRPY